MPVLIFFYLLLEKKSQNVYFKIEKNAGLVHEVAPDVRFSHEVALHKIPVTKLPRVSVLVSLHTWQSVFL